MALPAAAPPAGFGALLRTWRSRRRLSQLELAHRAEVSARHLSFLETGRARPSREMVLHLAEELDVPLRERNPMLLAAGFAPAYPEHTLDDDGMQAVRDALRLVLRGHEPCPALVVDRAWNLVDANAAAGLFVERLPAELVAPPMNVIRAALHPDGLARHVVNFDEYASHIVGRLRRQVERSADPDLKRLLDDVSDWVPGGHLHEPVAPHDVVLPIRLRLEGVELALFSITSVFGAPLDVTLDELAVEAFYPADPASAALLLARRQAAVGGAGSGRDRPEGGTGSPA